MKSMTDLTKNCRKLLQGLSLDPKIYEDEVNKFHR